MGGRDNLKEETDFATLPLKPHRGGANLLASQSCKSVGQGIAEKGRGQVV